LLRGSYLKSLHKWIEQQMTIFDHTFSYEEKDPGFCVCSDERWIEGCPLLNKDFIVVKN